MKYTQELIGEDVQVVNATDASLNQISGQICDETKMTLVVKSDSKYKVLLKPAVNLSVGGKIVCGAALVGRPEDRLKPKVKL